MLSGLPDWRERVSKNDKFDLLTDRWGELMYGSADDETLDVVEQLVQFMGQYENSFIAKRKSDGAIGVLFEVEFERDSPADEQQLASLIDTADGFARRYTQARFSVEDGAHVFDTRLALRCFIPMQNATDELTAAIGQVFHRL